MGFFGVAIVERKPWGILGLILNIIPGGVGNIVAGIHARETAQWVKGIIQLLLVWSGIVWIWSIVDGVRIFLNSTSYLPAAAAPPAATTTMEIEADEPAAAPAKRAAPKSAKKAAKKSAKKAAKK